ncbi:MAG: caspase family protein [Bryobacteraceae bacterium]
MNLNVKVHPHRASRSVARLTRRITLAVGAVIILNFSLSMPLVAAQADLRLQIGHWEEITSVAFSPDGQFALTGSRDRTAHLWDVATGREVRSFGEDSKDTYDKGINPVAFSPDGRSILTGDAGSTARLWDVLSGREIRRFKGHYRAVTSVAFSSDGRSALTVSNDYTARLWEVSSGRVIREIHSEAMLIHCAALSKDGRLILTGGGGGDNSAQLWDVASGREIRRFRGHAFGITASAFSPDGSTAVTASPDNTARLWDVRSAREIRRFNAPVSSVAFSPDGHLLATAGHDLTARLWDVASGREVRRLEHHLAPVSPVAFSPDGRLVITGGLHAVTLPGTADRIARLWDVASGREIRAFEGLSSVPNSVTLSPGGHSVLIGGDDSNAHLWDLSSGREIRVFEGHSAPIFTAKFSPDGSIVATGSGDRTARLWDVASGREIRAFRGHQDRINSLDFSPSGQTLATASDDRTVRVWDVPSGREMQQFPDLQQAKAVAFSSNGCCVLSGYSNGWGAVLWNAGNPHREIWSVGHYRDVNAVVFSPDGRSVLTGAGDWPKLSDALTGRQIRELGKPAGRIFGRDLLAGTPPVTALAFSSDGRSAITGHDNGTARLWDVATGREIRRIACASDLVKSVAVSRDDGYLFLGCSDGATRLFDRHSGALVATLVSFQDKGWAVVAPDGRFDTNDLDEEAPLHWRVDDEPLKSLPLEIFMRQYYTPRLLPRLLAHDPLPDLPDIAKLNRVQPEIHVVKVEAGPKNADALRVVLSVKSRREGTNSSGAKDLRLFRDGQLVRFREGDLSDGEYVFDGIPIAHKGPGQQVVFTAYAFNTDLVKSETARAEPYKLPANWPKRQGRAFLVNIGVNRTAAGGCDLHYAVTDAIMMQNMLEPRLKVAGYDVEKHLITADDEQPNGAAKTNLQALFADIARKASPDDAFILSYSGHGYTNSGGLFYMFPSDLQGSCEHIDSTLTSSAISSDELTNWIRSIDTGETVMILDACYSAASIESRDFKPGPMGSRGLGQLAYDKRIRVLAASQATQPAGEAGRLGMGYLSYALLKNGLDKVEADWQPKDGSIWLREWLAYAVEEVPKLYEDSRRDASSGKHDSRGVQFRQDATPLQVPALFDVRTEEDHGLVLEGYR